MRKIKIRNRKYSHSNKRCASSIPRFGALFPSRHFSLLAPVPPYLETLRYLYSVNTWVPLLSIGKSIPPPLPVYPLHPAASCLFAWQFPPSRVWLIRLRRFVSSATLYLDIPSQG